MNKNGGLDRAVGLQLGSGVLFFVGFLMLFCTAMFIKATDDVALLLGLPLGGLIVLGAAKLQDMGRKQEREYWQGMAER